MLRFRYEVSILIASGRLAWLAAGIEGRDDELGRHAGKAGRKYCGRRRVDSTASSPQALPVPEKSSRTRAIVRAGSRWRKAVVADAMETLGRSG